MLARRNFLFSFASLLAAQGKATVRAITKGPKYHWFGYYDKLEFDPTGRYILSNQVDFEHRSPTAADTIRVGTIDLQDNDRWTELGTSRAWNWQQGCMLQWLPGSRDEVIWNDRVDGQFVSHIRNVRTGKQRTLPGPVYSVSPDAKWAVSPDFRRLNQTRPGYGYAGIADPFEKELAPEQAGIWRMDLKTGKQKLLFSFADAVQVPNRHSPWEPVAKHWFNHLLHAPDGKRFLFLHRWRGPKQGNSFGTRMFTMDGNGKNAYILDPHGGTSHFVWRDPRHVLAWAKHPSHGEKFYLYRDQSEDVEVVDTYPLRNLQHLYLYEVASGKRVDLGAFASEPPYRGEWRCDLHPRSSPDGTKIAIDSSHGGNGRQIYLVDLAGIV